jgi:polar amino acid transport system substrate-binding protein
MRKSRTFIAVTAVLLIATAACSKSSGTLSGSGITKDATIAAEVPSDIAAKGTLTVASDASYPPMEFFGTDNKTIQGADVDLGNAIATIMGLKFSFVNAKFDGILAGVQAGKYDLAMSSFTDNTDREKQVDMVTYFQAGEAIFVKASSTSDFKTPDQLCGKVVAVESGTTELDDATAASAKCVQEHKPKITIHPFPDQNGANLDVLSGRADCGFADTEVVNYEIKVSNGQVKLTNEYVSPAPYGIMLPRPSGTPAGQAPLAKAVRDAMQKLMDSGEYKTILDKWGITAGALTASKINGATG